MIGRGRGGARAGRGRARGGGPGGAAAGAGAAAGRVCLSSFTSTALFPWVVLGAGALGPVLGKAARSVAEDTALSKAD